MSCSLVHCTPCMRYHFAEPYHSGNERATSWAQVGARRGRRCSSSGDGMERRRRRAPLCVCVLSTRRGTHLLMVLSAVSQFTISFARLPLLLSSNFRRHVFQIFSPGVCATLDMNRFACCPMRFLGCSPAYASQD